MNSGPDLRERIVLAMYPASTGGRGHAEALEKADRIVALIKGQFVPRDVADALAAAVDCATGPGHTRTHAMKSLPAALRRYRESSR